jgi:hypothetical protein
LTAPDFDGSETHSQDLSEHLFGTRDVWTNDGITDDVNNDAESECEWEGSDVVKVVLYCVIPMGLTIIGLLVYIAFKCMRDADSSKQHLLASKNNSNL